jgi:hypothetical protein
MISILALFIYSLCVRVRHSKNNCYLPTPCAPIAITDTQIHTVCIICICILQLISLCQPWLIPRSSHFPPSVYNEIYIQYYLY